jgi:hypothetical protein
MDHDKLLALWNTDDYLACEKGMMLAQAYLLAAAKELIV